MNDLPINPLLTRSGIWVITNHQDKRFYLIGADNVLFSIEVNSRKLYYGDHCLPPLLIEDYKGGKLTYSVLDHCIKDRFIIDLLKDSYNTNYLASGYKGYNKGNIKKYFVFFEIVDYTDLEGKSEVVVKVKLGRRQNRYGSITVGYFHTMKEAKGWAKQYYPDYDKKSVDRIVVASNDLTRKAAVNPLVADPKLLDLYRKVS